MKSIRTIALLLFALAAFATLPYSKRPSPPKSDPGPIPICGGPNQPACPPSNR